MNPVIDAIYYGDHGITFYEVTQSRKFPIGAYIAHTWNNLYLIPLQRPYFMVPEKKRVTTEIAGADGIIDSSSALTGYPLYNNRTGTIDFIVASYDYKTDTPESVLDSVGAKILDSNSEEIYGRTGEYGYDISQTWVQKYTQLQDMLHGKELIAVLDDDPYYYYRGFFYLNLQGGSDSTKVTLTYDLEPYKQMFKPNDPRKELEYQYFKFYDPVPDNGEIIITPSRMPTLPEFILDIDHIDEVDKKTVPSFQFQNVETGKSCFIKLDYFTNEKKWREYQQHVSTSAVFTNTNGRNTVKISLGNSAAFYEKYHIRMRIRKGDL